MNYDPDPNKEAATIKPDPNTGIILDPPEFAIGVGGCGGPHLSGEPTLAPPSLSVGASIPDTLTERGKRYGKFSEHAAITQALKDVMRDTPNWKLLAPYQKEALEMNAHKIGRILNGDPNYDDSWIDIAGYAQLVTDKLRGVE